MNDPDDVPAINVSRSPCGHPDNPHMVRSPVYPMKCTSCGETVPAALTVASEVHGAR